MKKLSVCRACKCKYLIDPARDTCPRCGGELFKTDLEEKYWELYTKEQRDAVIKNLMEQMEQDTQQKSATNGSADNARNNQNESAQSNFESAPSARKAPMNKGTKTTLMVLAAIVVLVLALVMVSLISSGKRRSTADTGSETQTASAVASQETPASTSEAGIPESTGAPETVEFRLPEDRIELVRDQDVVISRLMDQEFPYRDAEGTFWYDLRIYNLSAEKAEYEITEFMVQGVQLPSSFAWAIAEAGGFIDLQVRLEEHEMVAAGITDANGAAFLISRLSPGTDSPAEEWYIETDGYAVSVSRRATPEATLMYEDEEIVIRSRGVRIVEVPGYGPQLCWYALMDNPGEERLYFMNGWDTDLLNGRAITSSFIGTVGAHHTALLWGHIPEKTLTETGGEFQSLELHVVLYYHDENGDLEGDTKHVQIRFEAEPEPAAENVPAESDADSSGTAAGWQPYTYGAIVMDLPDDFITMPVGEDVYAIHYTNSDMDFVKLSYVITDINLDAVRQTTRETMEKTYSSSLSGYEGMDSFELGEQDGHPFTKTTYRMSNSGRTLTITEYIIFAYDGYFTVSAVDQTREVSNVLVQIVDSIRLTT